MDLHHNFFYRKYLEESVVLKSVPLIFIRIDIINLFSLGSSKVLFVSANKKSQQWEERVALQGRDLTNTT